VEQLYSPWTGFCEDLKKNLSDIKWQESRVLYMKTYEGVPKNSGNLTITKNYRKS
jgi:hypothetical protein